MSARSKNSLDQKFFNALNGKIIPLIKTGLVSPGRLPAGLVLLETRGRISGKQFDVPVVSVALGNYLLVGTVRKRSQWLRNLVANGHVDVWLQGSQREAKVLGFPVGSLHTATSKWGSGFALLALR